jgi:CrcB protein
MRGWPVGTLVVNLVGAFLIGLVAGGAPLKPMYREMLVIGVLGGFTTFAAFSWDMLSLARESNGTALVGLALSVVLPLAATYAGLRLSSVWFPAWH